MTKDFVHVDGNLGQDSIMPIQGKPLSNAYITVIANKVEELKETTGNRDISTGGTSSGVTAASAIAAMQEAGSKLSRDSNKASYRCFREVVLMVIELIRQFYDLPDPSESWAHRAWSGSCSTATQASSPRDLAAAWVWSSA